jgi:2-polyprenyl-3-methyl-5-hydroxy-6-metoxy-1,4-benzoquinol methylase
MSEPAETARAADQIARASAELGPRFPRCLAVFLAEVDRLDAACDAVERLPDAVARHLAEIAVLVGSPPGAAAESPRLSALSRRFANLRVHADPRRYGFGGRRKIALEYALAGAFDHVLLLDPDEEAPPEELARLWAAALGDEAQAVVAVHAGERARRAAARWLHARVLGTSLGDWASSYRLYSCAALRRVPFHLDSDDRRFDTEILIQLRALGAVVREVALDRPGRDHDFSIARSLACAVDYRLHQLHVTRRGRYLVDRDVRYTLKRHPSSSHAQILDAIRPGSRVLDLGCSQGLLAEPLRAKGVRVVGVDSGPPAGVSGALEAYHQRDLEQPLVLPEGRAFDYVVVADVIEHVVRRVELLKSVRRHLRSDGRLLISTPNIAIWFYRLSLAAGRFEYGPRGILDETHVHLFTRATFRREVESAGFKILRERVTGLPFEVVFESTGRSRLVRALASGYHALARLWPEMFAYQFLFEAEVATLLDRPSTPG